MAIFATTTSADFSFALAPEISPSKVYELSVRATEFYIMRLSVKLDFVLMSALIARILPQYSFVILWSYLCYELPSARILAVTALSFATIYFTILDQLLSVD